ncbi:MAG TPA: 5-methyltetrahydropteroyltriglutamate--homocysteine S-methyltransferase [Deltaproteobacteria bacterium]|nr:5-methyltetrahydropteroyltriglutamate--homocysteine S-methyltransferase [Deltaproteobacteria bacterium]
MKKHILGFPRIGAKRELKDALEAYWKGASSREDLQTVCRTLRERHWAVQQKAGLSFVATGDFSLYDHVLDITAMIGAVPKRFGRTQETVDNDTYFMMARGDSSRNIPAMEMTKWFNTNYHYIVPEIAPSLTPKLASLKILEETDEAIRAGYTPKPVLVGPITYISLSKGVDGFDCWEKCEEIVSVYAQVVSELGDVCEWIQIDEPILCADMCRQARNYFLPAYQRLNQAAGKAKLLLATYFDSLDENLDLALTSGCAGLHVDLVHGHSQLDRVLDRLPANMVLSAGIVNGRNIWRADLGGALDLLRKIRDRIGAERLMIGSSCSLLHSPVDLDKEQALDAELKSWMAFAVQKCEEVAMLGEILDGREFAARVEHSVEAVRTRRASPRVRDARIRKRCDRITPEMLRRSSPYPERKKAQSWLDLPLFPTTTIGSFPQTAEIRAQRKRFKDQAISEDQYRSFLRETIRATIERQEELGLDVLVHGEPERNDMVEYFGQQLSGFCITENGWVQSYGSRCVKPPIIYGDVSRPQPMTVEWISYAQSLTNKPMKGMLTGPVTILCWSFVRDDCERAEVCRQIALAIRDEVRDLEAAGIRIIQIDEAAFSEGMPIKQKDRAAYLRWAVDAFRLATAVVDDATQIHSHMCYSEFNDIIQSIAEMDADVISIESSRSRMELLEAFGDFEYPNEIGPGVYDIHSPRVPSAEEIKGLLEKALRSVPDERLWVNPDCGLKTRDWPEVVDSLRNMVAAARSLRALFARRQAQP